ncbi:Alpha/Beta hydrolase protein [Chytriomyces cf. hyalinus JEL632]|nr:Alpha/Beta hydrolase protein [Chytriomyces cf. hyalinus JEL632]
MAALVAIAALQSFRLFCTVVSRIPPTALMPRAPRLSGILLMFVGILGCDALTSFFVAPVVFLSWFAGPPRSSFLVTLNWVFYATQVLGILESFSVRDAAVRSARSFQRSLHKSLESTNSTPRHLETIDHPGVSFQFLLSAVVGWFWVPKDVDVIADIPYVSSQQIVDFGCTDDKSRAWLTLDVVRRKKDFWNRPVLVYVHGGAWAYGDKQKRIMPTCYHFASNENWVVLNINYRLAPKFNLHDMVVDVKRVIAWAKKNAHVHGGDPSFIAIAGGSAGAHLVSIAALTQNWAEFQPGFESADTSVQACYPIYPPVGHVRTNQFWKSWFMQKVVRISDAEYKQKYGRSVEDWCDPANLLAKMSVTERRGVVPPFFIVQGTFDTLARVHHVRNFVQDLNQGNAVGVGYLELPETHHAFDVAFSPRTQYVNWAAGSALNQVYKLKNAGQ